MRTPEWEVVVVGAGAAGLLAAARAAERGRRTLLLEKNRRPGIKILMSGGTRCNLTHDCDRRGIVRESGPAGRFCIPPWPCSRPPISSSCLNAWFQKGRGHGGRSGAR